MASNWIKIYKNPKAMKPLQLVKAIFKGNVFDLIFFFVAESKIPSRTPKKIQTDGTL
jgi:hypothetical protein